jgi:hypothetical protein
MLKLFVILFFISLGGLVIGLAKRNGNRSEVIIGISLCGCFGFGFLWAYWWFFSDSRCAEEKVAC